ncbi:MAG TPA: 6-bladed beta-propeller [Gracilimonas sp.]|uniref:6-bladed beta-propeller n=1 Tax=Gracilimonas sp. TaxID=1974203 RepID=UPI002D9D2004|nr:6-bladed beta-propeller [Gracilimonas sp.]
MKSSLDGLMIPSMKYSKRLLLSIFLCFSLIQCSDNSKPEKAVPTELPEQAEKIEPNRVLDEIPQHIQEVENLTIFPGDSEPLYSIALIPAQSFGETGEPYLTRILGCVVDDHGGVIIHSADANYEQILHVYNAYGTYHAQLGRQGRGPGEYGNIVGIQAKAGKVFVLDYTSQRLNEYSTKDYSFMRSILLENWKSGDGLRFGYIEARNDGNYLLVFSENRSKPGRLESKYQVMDHAGNKVSAEPLVFPYGFRIKVGQSIRPTMPITFLGTTLTALSHEDALYAVWTNDFLIKKYDAKGEYQSAIYYPIQGSPFDLNEYSKTQLFSPKVGDIEKAFATMDEELPENFPVVDKLMVDDKNRIWVAVPAGAEREYYEWWILNETGELLAKLVLPKDQRIYDIKNGHLYSKETDEETGAEFVIKYRVELIEK